MRPALAHLARLAIAVVALILISRLVDLRAVSEALRGADPLLLLGGVACWCTGAAGLTTLRWQLLLATRGSRIPFAELLSLSLIGFLYTTIVTQVAGDAVKTERLVRRRSKRAELAATVFIDRLVGVVGLVGIALLGLLLSAHETNAARQTLLILAVLVLGGTVLFLWLPQRLTESSSTSSSLAARIVRIAQKVLGAVTAFRNHPFALGVALLLSMGAQLVLVASGVLLLSALNASIGFSDMMWLFSLVLIAQSIPITIAGIGTRDATAVYLMSLLGISAATAVAFSLLLLLANLVLAVVGLIIELRAGFGLPFGKSRTAGNSA